MGVSLIDVVLAPMCKSYWKLYWHQSANPTDDFSRIDTGKIHLAMLPWESIVIGKGSIPIAVVSLIDSTRNRGASRAIGPVDSLIAPEIEAPIELMAGRQLR